MSSEKTATDYFASLPHQVTSAAALFRDPAGRVLLVQPTYKQDGWLLPGGSLDAGESPLGTARREIKEELGLELSADCPLLVIDWVPAADERPAICVFVFDGGVLDTDVTDRIRLQRDELAAWRFVADDELADLLPAHRQRRVEACKHALAVGHPIYVDPGRDSQTSHRASCDELKRPESRSSRSK